MQTCNSLRPVLFVTPPRGPRCDAGRSHINPQHLGPYPPLRSRRSGGRLQRLIIYPIPTMLTYLWTTFSAMLDPVTREKFIVLGGDASLGAPCPGPHLDPDREGWCGGGEGAVRYPDSCGPGGGANPNDTCMLRRGHQQHPLCCRVSLSKLCGKQKRVGNCGFPNCGLPLFTTSTVSGTL